MNIHKLELLVEVLREVQDGTWKTSGYIAPAGFHLGTWVDSFYDVEHNPTEAKKHAKTTTACACGFAGLDHRFHELGFGVVYDVPSYKGEIGWTAVRNFFELTKVQSRWLFHPEGYPDGGQIQTVIDRINSAVVVYQSKWYRPLMDWVNNLFPKVD